jgi:1-deoxy-D-xylulose-5-phosphate reductoisomerase
VKRVVILGSTGSIGRQAIDVANQHPDRLRIVGLAAKSNAENLRQQASNLGISRLALYDEAAAHAAGLPGGMNALVELASHDCDLVIVSVAGVIGLLPTMAAIRAGKDIALASKEVLVAAGEVVMPLVKEQGVSLTPIDSEHSAIFQCMQGYTPDQVAEIIITASGGPFRGRKRSELERVTVEEALAHPTWRMGGKITIDSATLMNKALETIEAKWLFGLDIGQVSAVIHPQSVIHSMVKFKDGSVLGQLGWPDMRLPIQYALLYPERKENTLAPWNPVDTPMLTFEPVDEHAFPALELARRSVRAGGTMPCVLNAANEEAANGFLVGKTPFLKIVDVVEKAMERHEPVEPSLNNLLAADEWARQTTRELMEAN